MSISIIWKYIDEYKTYVYICYRFLLRTGVVMLKYLRNGHLCYTCVVILGYYIVEIHVCCMCGRYMCNTHVLHM